MVQIVGSYVLMTARETPSPSSRHTSDLLQPADKTSIHQLLVHRVMSQWPAFLIDIYESGRAGARHGLGKTESVTIRDNTPCLTYGHSPAYDSPQPDS